MRRFLLLLALPCATALVAPAAAAAAARRRVALRASATPALSVSTRKASLEDIPAIQLCRAMPEPGATRARSATFVQATNLAVGLKRGDRAAFVAVDDSSGKVVGTIECVPTGKVAVGDVPPRVLVKNVFTRPDARGNGVASALVQSSLDYAVAEAIPEVWLDVSALNAPARSLYRKFGFVAVDWVDRVTELMAERSGLDTEFQMRVAVDGRSAYTEPPLAKFYDAPRGVFIAGLMSLAPVSVTLSLLGYSPGAVLWPNVLVPLFAFGMAGGIATELSGGRR